MTHFDEPPMLIDNQHDTRIVCVTGAEQFRQILNAIRTPRALRLNPTIQQGRSD